MVRWSPFEGVWNVTDATLPDGASAYTGIVMIKRWNEVFLLDWEITAGRYVGIGMTVGEQLFVSCGEQFGGLGIALYQLDAQGAVSVAWATREGAGVRGTGRFVIGEGGSFVGEHRVIHHLSGGELYGEWTLSIEEEASVYTISWCKGEAVHWRGLGLPTSNGMAAGWYPDIAQLAFLDYQLDPENKDKMHARWTLGGYVGIGTETLVRTTRD